MNEILNAKNYIKKELFKKITAWNIASDIFKISLGGFFLFSFTFIAAIIFMNLEFNHLKFFKVIGFIALIFSSSFILTFIFMYKTFDTSAFNALEFKPLFNDP